MSLRGISISLKTPRNSNKRQYPFAMYDTDMSSNKKLHCKNCGREITKHDDENCDGMCLECWDDE